MNWENCTDPPSITARLLKGLDQSRRADVASVGIDIDEQRPRAGLDDRGRRCDKRHRNRYDLVAGTDTHGQKGQAKRVGAAGDSNHVAHAEVVGEFFLERCDRGSANVRGVLANRREFGCEPSFDLAILRCQIQELDSHLMFHLASRSAAFCIDRAGWPATRVRAGTFLVTSAPAPIIAPSPISTPQRMTAPLPMDARRRITVRSNFQSLSSWLDPSA